MITRLRSQTRLALLCALAACAAAAADRRDVQDSPPLWERGNYSVFTVTSNFSFSLVVGGSIKFVGRLPREPPPNAHAESVSGDDPVWGGFDELRVVSSPTSSGAHSPEFPSILYAIRYFHASDVFSFSRLYYGAGDQTFPWLELESGASAGDVGVIGYSTKPMEVASAGNLTSCTNSSFGDGPLFLHVKISTDSPDPVPAAPALAFSALDGFSVNGVGCGPAVGREEGGAPASFGARAFAPASVPPDTSVSSLLVVRPGLKRVTVAWGAAMRQRYDAVRHRRAGVSTLSYWTDNNAGYSFWSHADNLTTWGVPQELFRQLSNAYAAVGVPVRNWEVDTTFSRENGFGSGWCWRDWDTWNRTLFPSASNFSRAALGTDASLTLYVPAFCNDTVYRSRGYEFVSVVDAQGDAVAVVHPNTAQSFYADILASASRWGMAQLFSDFLCWRGPLLDAALPHYFQASHDWLEGMTAAVDDAGLEMQACMACAHQLLDTLTMPAVTNARASPDGGTWAPRLVYSSVLLSSLGLGWSKDNLRLRLGSSQDAELQTLLAALSLGPVGLADQLQGYPAPPEPGGSTPVVTNATLAMSTCAANGTLLQPSFPLTPVGDLLAGEGGLSFRDGNVWATFTVVGDGDGGSTSGGGHVWFTALGFSWSGDEVPYPLRPSTLWPMLDTLTLAPAQFDDVPRGTYAGDGRSLPPGTPDYVAWHARLGESDGTTVVPFSESKPYAVPLGSHQPYQVNLAPVLGSTALLGEVGKAAAVSSFRFAAVSLRDGGQVAVEMRGAPGETVQLLYAQAPAFDTATQNVTIGRAGTATATLPHVKRE